MTKKNKAKKTPKFLVVLTEYERGWGSKDFLALPYQTRKAAEKRVKEENSENTLPYVPDYYIVARLVDCKDITPNQLKYYLSL